MKIRNESICNMKFELYDEIFAEIKTLFKVEYLKNSYKNINYMFFILKKK
jgi:hypothetical protein